MLEVCVFSISPKNNLTQCSVTHTELREWKQNIDHIVLVSIWYQYQCWDRHYQHIWIDLPTSSDHGNLLASKAIARFLVQYLLCNTKQPLGNMSGNTHFSLVEKSTYCYLLLGPCDCYLRQSLPAKDSQKSILFKCIYTYYSVTLEEVVATCRITAVCNSTACWLFHVNSVAVKDGAKKYKNWELLVLGT